MKGLIMLLGMILAYAIGFTYIVYSSKNKNN